MNWKDGRLVKAVIRSTIGGNLRLRSYNRLFLQGKELKELKKDIDNVNPLFVLQQISRPMVSEKAPLKGLDLRKTYLYDQQTQVGEVLVFEGE